MDRSFLDPRLTKDGKAYGPARFKKIVEECWMISDNIHTSYTDVLNLSFQERVYLLELINKKLKDTKEAIEDAQAELKAKSRQG